jgi:hypothetical protein
MIAPLSRTSCPICNALATVAPPVGDYKDVDCSSCGGFRLTCIAEVIFSYKQKGILPLESISDNLRNIQRLYGSRLLVDDLLLDELCRTAHELDREAA